MSVHAQVEQLLAVLHQEMKLKDQWSASPIPPEALLSQQPFCVDTMSFNQWLQFVFIPRMQALVEGKHTLPKMMKGQGIEPMASEYFKQHNNCQSIIAVIAQLDELLSD